MPRRLQPLTRARRHNVLSSVAAVAFRLITRAQRKKSLWRAAWLFQRVLRGFTLGYGWIPRTWSARRHVWSRWFTGQVLRIHRGRRWRRLYVHRWAVGFAAGNFARTQTLAVFKKKSSTKKKKKRVQTISPHSDMKIQLIKDVKAGRRRRTSLTLDKSYEAQLRAAEG